MYAKHREAVTTERDEVLLTVPVALTRGTNGLSLDMGGSVLKFVYRSREDLDESRNEDIKFGHLHLVSFAKSELDLALEYVRYRAQMTRTGVQPTPIYTTGVGCTEFGKLICDKLNVTLENITEFDCFVKAFLYLGSSLPAREFVEPYLEEASIEPLNSMMEQMGVMKDIMDSNLTQAKFAGAETNLTNSIGRSTINPDVPLVESQPFPCLLAMCGSGFGFMMINADGTFHLVDGSNRGGKTFFGLGTLLTGCKNYKELIELASQGNPQNVDVYTDALFNTDGAADGDQSMYSKAGKITFPSIVYAFGKTVGSKIDNFKRADLARAWLNYVVLDTVQILHLQCLLLGIKRIFFCGSFCNSRLVRETLTMEFVRRNLLQAAWAKADVIQFDFLKPGPHLGALGAMINEIEKFIGK